MCIARVSVCHLLTPQMQTRKTSEGSTYESRKNEDGPEEYEIPTWSVEISARNSDGERRSQNSYRAELKGAINVHINCA